MAGRPRAPGSGGEPVFTSATWRSRSSGAGESPREDGPPPRRRPASRPLPGVRSRPPLRGCFGGGAPERRRAAPLEQTDATPVTWRSAPGGAPGGSRLERRAATPGNIGEGQSQNDQVLFHLSYLAFGPRRGSGGGFGGQVPRAGWAAPPQARGVTPATWRSAPGHRFGGAPG